MNTVIQTTDTETVDTSLSTRSHAPPLVVNNVNLKQAKVKNFATLLVYFAAKKVSKSDNLALHVLYSKWRQGAEILIEIQTRQHLYKA